MARLNVIANYNCDTKTFDERNVFSIQGVWDCPPIVSCFYGTLGLMSGFMNRNGAYPGIKSVCPLTLAVDGASDHLTTLAQKIGALDSDSVYTMFLDESTVGFMLTMEEVFRVNIVINRVGEGFEKELPACRGWKVVDHKDTMGGYSVYTLEKDADAKLGDDAFNLDIDALEKEMNRPGIADLTPESIESINEILKTTEDAWVVFKRYNRDMIAFLANTSAPDDNGGFGDGYDGCLEGGADGMESITDDMRNTPASLALVMILSNTLKRQADMVVENRKRICEFAKTAEAQGDALKELNKKFAEYDQIISDAFRKFEEEQGLKKQFDDERLSGLTNQISLLAMELRIKSWTPAVCAVISLVLLAVFLFLK